MQLPVVPVVAGAGHQPVGPGRGVDDQRDHDERERQPQGVAQRAADERRQARGPAGADVPRDAEAAEPDDVPGRDPLGPHRQAQHDAAHHLPLAQAEPGPGVPAVPAGDPLGQLGPGLVPVDDHAAERGQHEEHQEDVQDAGPGQHELQAVQGHQQPGQAAEQGGPGHPPRDAADQQDGQRPEHRAGEPPAERVQPEQPLTDRDQQLAHLGLDHVLPAAGAAARREQAGGVPGLDQRVGVAGPGPTRPRAAGCSTRP